MIFPLPAAVSRALTMLEEAGFSAYTVGGCVRDWVLGVAPHDYDICTSAPPEEMKKVFRGEKTVETGIRHGTLTVLLEGMALEITVFRVDGEYLDGRHPDSVRFTDRVEEDLSRRDFTVNAMAYSPRRGIVDPFGGREDCKRGIIRCVGDPAARFGEDALRILRALRFSARLGFPIEEKTAQAVRAQRDQLIHVSRERIAVELTGLLLGGDAEKTLRDFPEVAACVLPEISPLIGGPAWPPTLRRIACAPAQDTLRWAALLGNVGAEGAAQAAKSLKMSVKATEEISALVAWMGCAATEKNVQEMLMRLGPDRLDKLIRLQAADAVARGEEQKHARAREKAALGKVKELLDQNACYTLGQLAVGGRDVSALGLRGPDIGKTLNELLLRVVRGEIPNEKSALLAAAQAMARP